MDLNDVFTSASLKASDLKGREVEVAIERYEIKDFDDGNKIVLHFVGAEKTLICNKTNANTIADMHGTDIDGWVGKKITLFPTQTDFNGKQVPCIRVKIGGPAPPATDVNATDENAVPF